MPLASARMPYEPAPVAIAVMLRRVSVPDPPPQESSRAIPPSPVATQRLSRISPLMPGEQATPPLDRTSTRCTVVEVVKTLRPYWLPS